MNLDDNPFEEVPRAERRIEFVEYQEDEVPGTVPDEECVVLAGDDLFVGRRVRGVVRSIERLIGDDLGREPTIVELFVACGSWSNGYLHGREMGLG